MITPARLLVAMLPTALWSMAAQGATRDINAQTRSFSTSVRDFSPSIRDLSFPVVQTMAVQEVSNEIRIELPADILFDFDRAAIRDEARSSLAAAAAVLHAHAGAAVRIEGHADAKGSEAHNLPLSLKRAAAVRLWLADHEGLRLTGATTAGFGSRRPAVPNIRPDGSDDPDGRQRNRRVEIIIAK